MQQISSMKISAILLSVYILTLSVLSCPNAYNVEDVACQTEQPDCADCCSPFSLCHTCIDFVTANIVYIITKPQELSVEINIFELYIYMDILLNDIWQPPKFA